MCGMLVLWDVPGGRGDYYGMSGPSSEWEVLRGGRVLWDALGRGVLPGSRGRGLLPGSRGHIMGWRRERGGA